MERLVEGYRRFREGAWQARRELFDDLARGQHPRAVLIGCCDSRIDPAVIFDALPGELFVIRNVANLVPPYGPDTRYHGTSAALEFAVRTLGIDNIVVLGHGACGGAAALISGRASGEFLDPWLEIAAPVRSGNGVAMSAAARQRETEHAIVKLSLDNLTTFPWIAEPLSRGALTLHGMWFDIVSGELWRLGEDGRFAAVQAG